MNVFYLILLAVAPGIILTLFILFQDRYDKEPVRLLIKVFLFGMLATIPTLIVEIIGRSFNIFTGIFGLIFEAFIVIGLAEEFFKRRVVLKTVYNHPAFNERLDGIVYCSVAALGFATLENIIYVVSYYTVSPDIWIMRALLSVPIHMLLGITMGYFLSLAKYCTNLKKCSWYYKKSLLLPALLHGAFDFMLMSSIPLLSLTIIPFVAYLWISSMIKLSRYRKESKAQNS